jgi:hypothetical protein
MILNLAKYDIAIKPKDLIILPENNKGNILRGGFGNTFKKMVCVKDLEFQCKNCELLTDCPYPVIFEPAPPTDSQVLSKNSDIPRPYIIKPPLTRKTNYTKDDTIRFSIILVNKVIKLLPYFITTFKELGNIGIGVNRGKYNLESISNNSNEIFKGGILQNSSEEFDISLPLGPVSYIKLDFLTETTIKSEGKILEKPDFSGIIKRLRDRIASLAVFFGEKWEADFIQIGKLSESIKVLEDNTYWNEKSRYSKRSNVKHDMSGFIGDVSFEGDLTPFMELLKLGELIHVGKGSVFGNGWYKIAEVK